MRKYKSKFLIEFEDNCTMDKSVTTFINFGRTVQGKNMKPNKIKRLFKTIVGLQNYPEFTIDEVVNHFVQISSRKLETI